MSTALMKKHESLVRIEPETGERRPRKRPKWPRRVVLGMLGLGTLMAMTGRNTASAQHPYQDARVAPISSQFSVSLESAGGGSLPTHWEGNSMWVEGSEGQAYQIRVQNHSNRRVEAVVTVDGRDVLTGDNGNYAKHRGYVIQPYGSVVIDGFRQSMDHVAQFRFTGQHDAYSARMGTPQNVGVIGVAVFEEKAQRAKRTPRPVQPRPYYDPVPYDEAPPSAWGGSDKRSSGRGNSAKPTEDAAAAPEAEAAPSSRAPRGGAYGYDGDYGGGYGGYVQPPRRDERLGTQYGETHYSSVREVTFKRKSSRRPDALLTVYYDSWEGLRSRGIVPEPPPYPPYPYEPEPEPWPDPRFAPPPPPRRY